MMKGEENCTAAIAAVDFRIVRRSTGQDRSEIPVLSSQVTYLDDRHSSTPFWAGSVTLPVCFYQ
jgi:hypothetical protein